MIRFRVEFEHALRQFKENRAFRYSFFAGAAVTAALFCFIIHLTFDQGWVVGVGWVALFFAGVTNWRRHRHAMGHIRDDDESQPGNQS